MKDYKDKFFILIASIIIGLLITMNFSLGRTTRVFQLDSKEYKNATEEKNNLYVEIDSLRDQNKALENKIYSYKVNDSNDGKIIQDMKMQLKDYSEINGSTPVKGSGIVIRVTDGAYSSIDNTQFEINRAILHDIDVALIINELRSVGAQSIAINDYRILGDTGVECDWAFIGFNDNAQSMEGQPFHFYALGDPDEMEVALFSEGSHINKLIIRNLDITIEKREEIILPETSRILEAKHMERVD